MSQTRSGRPIQPLLPPKTPYPKGGRPWIEDRALLGGIIYVLRAGVPWRLLPAKGLGCSGVTCWRRLRDWQAAGVWEALHHRLLDRLVADGQVDWSRAAIDSERAGPGRGADRGKAGSKYHLLIDATGLPLAVGLSATNTHNSQLLEPLVDAMPAVIGPRGRPGRRADILQAFLHLACALICVRKLQPL